MHRRACSARSGRSRARPACRRGASGRAFDARKTPGYSPYDTVEFEIPVMSGGDVNSRVWVRIREVEESMRLIEQILNRLPEGPILQSLHARAEMREGLGIVEGFRGDVFVWIRLDGDRVSRPTGEPRPDRCGQGAIRKSRRLHRVHGAVPP